ncbi:MAG TPA: hypothetical protein VF056_08735 [Thermoleophilaceae bacterium]
MQTAGARALREDDHEDMSREAVLLQWERKIEAEERRPNRSERADDETGEGGTVAELRPTEDATHEVPRRFERRAAELLTEQPLAERRTVTITGHPTPARRRAHSVMNSPMAQPERLGLWAFLLGLFLMVVAAGTAHA